jgi:hypothetical protein
MEYFLGSVPGILQVYSTLVVYQVPNLQIPHHYTKMVRLWFVWLLYRQPNFCVKGRFCFRVVEVYLNLLCGLGYASARRTIHRDRGIIDQFVRGEWQLAALAASARSAIATQPYTAGEPPLRNRNCTGAIPTGTQ